MNGRKHSRGFALVTALLLLLLLSMVAVGVIYSVVTEQALGGNDKESLAAFYGAEAAMEKMMVDIGNLYSAKAAPKTTDIQALGSSNYQPSISGITYNTYTFTVPSTDTNGYPYSTNHTITSGSNQGLYAEMVPVTLTVDAQRTVSGADVQMTRNVDVALIPVFQFGIFSTNDIVYNPNVAFSFGGRVATNGNLFIAPSGTTVTFHSKVSAYLNIIRTQAPNGTPVSSPSTAYIPTTSNGCEAPVTSNCRSLATNEGSLTGGVGSSTNASWNTISKTTYNGMLVNGTTGAGQLTLPFVADGFQPIELIRQPWPGESTTSDVYQSRLYAISEIRVLLQDVSSNLPTTCSPSCSPVRLANVSPYYVAPVAGYSGGTFGTVTSGQAFAEGMTKDPSNTVLWETGLGPFSNCMPYQSGTAPYLRTTAVSYPCYANPGPVPYSTAGGTTLVGGQSGFSLGRQDFVKPPSNPSGSCVNADGTTGCCANLTYTYTNNDGNANCWPLIDGYLLVQARQTDGTYKDVTQEWLSLGISRDSSNTMNNTNSAILHFQTYRDINGDGSVDVDAIGAPTTGACSPVVSLNNGSGAGPCWSGGAQNLTYGNPKYLLSDQDPRKYYPINTYDPREGLFRDSSPAPATTAYKPGSTTNPYYYYTNLAVPFGAPAPNLCTVGGVINLIELDVNNLRRWLNGANLPPTGSGTGTSVDGVSQNGYIFYFSDRRGMLNNPSVTMYDGSTGSRQTGGYGFEDIVNGNDNDKITGAPNGYLDPGEDSNSSGTLDTWGGANVANGFQDYNGDTVGSIGQGSAVLPNSQPQTIIPCQVGRKNRVTGARHGLRLVNGGSVAPPYLPARAVGSNLQGGFTVVSENPVYVLGPYNASLSSGPFTEPNCASTTGTTGCHVSAAIIADAVTVLSGNWHWGDANSTYGIMNYPGQTTGPTPNLPLAQLTASNSTTTTAPNCSSINAIATCTSQTNISPDWFIFNHAPGLATYRVTSSAPYRMAVAAGTSVNFTLPSIMGIPVQFGNNGGVQDFLRYEENWGTAGVTLYYMGSFVSMYYSEYANGVFKLGGSTVYAAPTRNYSFDGDFLYLNLLPPGTPRFRDVENVGFQQIFSPY